MREKLVALGGIAIAGAGALIAGSQPWVNFMLDGTHSLEAVTGHEVNAALSPVAIAVIAAALALTIAGRVFRRVLGALVALLGAGIVALTSTVIADPAGAVQGRVAELTGISGTASQAALVWIDTTAGTWVSIAAGVLAVVLGIAVLVRGGRWAAGGRKYDSAVRSAGAAPDRISDWDSLSDGDDPTATSRS